MIIKSLELKNFRNYESLGIAFDAGTNILYGDNAQGKTNVLESLYVSGTTKSHKGSKDRVCCAAAGSCDTLSDYADKYYPADSAPYP